MKDTLEELARETLNQSGYIVPFDGDDLCNALTIQMHVSMNLAWIHFENLGLSMEQRELLAEEFGKNIRQSITLFTGIDPADAVRGELWPEVVTDAER